MTYKFDKAVMIYGAAEYPLHGLRLPQSIESVADLDLDALAADLHFCNPALAESEYRARMKTGTTPAAPQFNLAAYAVVHGSGFRIVYKEK